MPKSGTVTGRVELAFYDDRVRCAADVELSNVTYGIDSTETILVANRARSLEREVGRLLVNGRVLAGCDGEPGNPNYRVAPAIQAAVTTEAVRRAPPVVRAAAGFDQRRAAMIWS